MVIPFDLEMASNLFQKRRSRKGVDIELGFGKHQELNLMELRDVRLRRCKTMEGILLSSIISRLASTIFRSRGCLFRG